MLPNAKQLPSTQTSMPCMVTTHAVLAALSFCACWYKLPHSCPTAARQAGGDFPGPSPPAGPEAGQPHPAVHLTAAGLRLWKADDREVHAAAACTVQAVQAGSGLLTSVLNAPEHLVHHCWSAFAGVGSGLGSTSEHGMLSHPRHRGG